MKADIYILDIGRLGWELPDRKETVERLILGLSPARQDKIRAFRYEKSRYLSLGAGLLLDYGLRAYGLRERDLRVAVGAWGKPYFPDHPKLHFNLSHSGTMVMAGFSSTEIGCDVEQVVRVNEKVARRFFAPEEQSALFACTSIEERTDLFYRIWTRKESYIKLTGEGMHLDLESFSVVPGKDCLSCTFQEFPVPGYRAAACVKVDDQSDAVFFSFQNLHDVV